MSDSLILLDIFARGAAAGGMLVAALALWRSGVNRHAKLAVALTAFSVVAWLIVESVPLWSALGRAYPVALPAYFVAGCFWLLVATVFEDRPVNAATLWPAGVLLAAGIACDLTRPPISDALWAARNAASALLALHAGVIVLRGWRGDLVEGRRGLRGALLGSIAVLTVINVAFAFAYRIDPTGPWLELTVSRPLGGALFSALILGTAALFLQARPAVFGPSRRSDPLVDARAEAADRLTLQKLDLLMAAEGWRREGLTIGHLARELDTPEHRLRRLINQRLGHRNFADFVNSHRIEAAKRRLSDPAEARTTIAAIAFDLGYGSLGPFNRAFRAATGATPTEWRRQALSKGSPELQQAS